jgi:uncharacterized protein YjbJ (UPF0337 family)
MNTQQIQGQWNTLRGKVKAKWGQLTDDDLQLASGNVDQLIGRIQQKTGEGRESIERFFDELVEGGGNTASQVKEAAIGYAQEAGTRLQEGYGQAREQMQQGYRQTQHMIEARPTESMATVLGVGVLTGVLVGLTLWCE